MLFVLQIKYRKKIVDATLCETKVPSNSPPGFSVSSDANFIPINGLSSVQESPEKYLIVGAGKTGVDAVLYLLDNGVDPDKLMWIMPSDVWFMNRVDLTDDSFYPAVCDMFECFADEENDTWEKCLKA